MDPPSPKDLSHHYSRVVQRTGLSQIKKFYKYFTIPGIGNLAGGLPNASYFPFDDIEAKVALPDRFKPTPNVSVDPEPTPPRATKANEPSSHIVVPHDSAQLDRTRKIDLSIALQYGIATGLSPLKDFVRELARTKMHPNVPYKGGPETLLTCGSTDGFNKVLHIFSDIWDDRRDWIRDRPAVLCEEFTYMNAIQSVTPRGLNIVPVAIDGEGMMADGPKGLREILENWDRSKGRVPHLMYTVTIGQNPTGGVLSLERKRQIYSLCQKYDILIVEDDPYWFLQYPSANHLSMEHRGKHLWDRRAPSGDTWKRSGSAFLDSLAPSYLSIDTDGRVIRLDTFSKTIAPGCRLGWITAQPAFIAKFIAYTDLSTQQPSGFVQSLVAEMIVGQQLPTKDGTTDPSEKTWHIDGWVRWLEGLRGSYEQRMQTMAQTLESGKHKITTEDLVSEPHDFEVVSRTLLFDFNFPMGGMFLWLRMQFENHPLFDHPLIPVATLSWAFFLVLTKPKYNVLAGPGTIFAPTPEVLAEKGPYYFRLCFAGAPEESLKAMCDGFVSGVNDFFEIKDPQHILDIIREDENDGGQTVANLSAKLDTASLGTTMY